MFTTLTAPHRIRDTHLSIPPNRFTNHHTPLHRWLLGQSMQACVSSIRSFATTGMPTSSFCTLSTLPLPAWTAARLDIRRPHALTLATCFDSPCMCNGMVHFLPCVTRRSCLPSAVRSASRSFRTMLTKCQPHLLRFSSMDMLHRCTFALPKAP